MRTLIFFLTTFLNFSLTAQTDISIVPLGSDIVISDQNDAEIAHALLNVNGPRVLDMVAVTLVFDDNQGASAQTLFRDIELRVDGVTYPLDGSIPSAQSIASLIFSDLDISLSGGSHDVVIQCNMEQDLSQFAEAQFHVEWDIACTMNMCGGITLLQNGQEDTSFDPAHETHIFDIVTVFIPTVTVAIVDPVDQTVPIGSQGISAVEIEITSDVQIDLDEVVFNIHSYTGWLNELRLYKLESAPVLLVTESGYDIDAAGDVDFDLNQTFSAGSHRLLLEVDLSDDHSFIGISFSVNTVVLDIEWETSDPIDVSDQLPLLGRTLTITDKGFLDVFVVDSPMSNADKHILGGSSSFVATFGLSAVNEGIVVKDLSCDVAGLGYMSFAQAITQMKLYDNGLQILESLSASSQMMFFENINVQVMEGDTFYVHVELDADLIGYNQAGTVADDMYLTMSVHEAEGMITEAFPVVTYDNEVYGFTNPSPLFDVVAAKVATIELVQDCDGGSLSSVVVGETVDETVAMLKITADTWQNTTLSGLPVELVISEFSLANDSTEIVVLSEMSASHMQNAARSAASGSSYGVTSLPGGQFAFDTGDGLILQSGESVCVSVVSDARVREDGSFALDFESQELVAKTIQPMQTIHALRSGSTQVDGIKIPTQFICPDVLVLDGTNTIPYKRERAAQAIYITEEVQAMQHVIYDAPHVIVPSGAIVVHQYGALIEVQGVGCSTGSE